MIACHKMVWHWFNFYVPQTDYSNGSPKRFYQFNPSPWVYFAFVWHWWLSLLSASMNVIGEWLLPLARRLHTVFVDTPNVCCVVCIMRIFTPIDISAARAIMEHLIGFLTLFRPKIKNTKFLNLRFWRIDILPTSYNVKPINKLLLLLSSLLRRKTIVFTTDRNDTRASNEAPSLCSFIIWNWIARKWASPSGEDTQPTQNRMYQSMLMLLCIRTTLQRT